MSRNTFPLTSSLVIRRVSILSLLIAGMLLPTSTFAQPQESADGSAAVASDDGEPAIETPEKVEVDPVAEDSDISTRLTQIFEATGWFESVEVTADEGVVFLSGVADSESHREWAERLAQRTSDVVAVVNQIKVRAGPVWDIRPALIQLQQLGRDLVQLLPLLVVGILILLLAYGLAKLVASVTRRFVSRRLDSQLLRQVIASVAAVLVMLVGLYIALKVSGLSRLAVTVLGGTGLVGLALGFAFRDIAENYLASILISLNRPFNVGDLIQLDSHKGFVRRVTTRGTLLLTVEGNHIQIPNATVYKSVITNFSSSPRIRQEFAIGIGYDDSVAEAQEVLYETLKAHEAVLDDPAPMVLVDSLGASTVNLKVLFWLDATHYDAASVRSALMRQAKIALIEANISMPDEAREVVFPNGVPVTMADNSGEATDVNRVENAGTNGRTSARSHDPATSDKVHATDAEGDLQSSSDKLQQQAAADEASQGENLID